MLHEIVFRAGKHVLRRLIRGLQPEHVPCAISHFLNCLIGTGYNASPTPIYHSIELSSESEPAFVVLTPRSLRDEIVKTAQARFRWDLDSAFLSGGLRKQQVLREFATRFAFQLLQRDYIFDSVVERDSDDDKENVTNPKDRSQRRKKAVAPQRVSTFEPSDILTLVPVVRSTAPTVSNPTPAVQLTHSWPFIRSRWQKRSSKPVERRSTVAISISVSNFSLNPFSYARTSIPSSIPKSLQPITNTHPPSIDSRDSRSHKLPIQKNHSVWTCPQLSDYRGKL